MKFGVPFEILIGVLGDNTVLKYVEINFTKTLVGTNGCTCLIGQSCVLVRNVQRPTIICTLLPYIINCSQGAYVRWQLIAR